VSAKKSGGLEEGWGRKCKAPSEIVEGKKAIHHIRGSIDK